MGYLSELRPFGRPARADLDDLLGRFLAPGVAPSTRKEPWMPRVDIVEKPDAFEVTADVPGTDPEDVHITVTGDTLTIRGERKPGKPPAEGEHQHVTERVFGAFERTFGFPSPVAVDDVEAQTKHGVITIRVPKSREAQPRRIDVRLSK